jgi:acyl-coenzyme A thioesterase PaaI-like protein
MAIFNTRNSQCVICGESNRNGLGVRFEPNTTGVHAWLRVPRDWQGYEAVVHGGIVAGLLDDAMWHAIYHLTGRWTVTAEIQVRYKRPVSIEQPIWITGWLDRTHQRLLRAAAEIRQGSDQGPIQAAAQGRFMPAPETIIRGSRHEL